MKYKQDNPWGCGMYAVANACKLDNFVTDSRLQESKEHGNRIGQLSKWLFSLDYQSEFREVSHVEKTPPMRRMVAGITILGFYARIDLYSFGPALKRAEQSAGK